MKEKDFGRIQIDRIAEMQKWAENIKNVEEHMNLAIVAAKLADHQPGFQCYICDSSSRSAGFLLFADFIVSIYRLNSFSFLREV